MSSLGPPNIEAVGETVPTVWTNSFYEAWSQKEHHTVFGIRSVDGTALTCLLQRYPKSVTLFLCFIRALALYRRESWHELKSCMFARSRYETEFSWEAVDKPNLIKTMDPGLAGSMGNLLSLPTVPQPIPSGTYGTPYREHGDQRAKMTRFFLEAIRHNQLDVVKLLLDRYLVKEELWNGCCIDDPIYAAVRGKYAVMVDLIFKHARGTGPSYSRICSPIESGNNAGEEGSMSCGMEDYSLNAAVHNNDIATLSVLLRKIETQPKNETGWNDAYHAKIKEKAMASAVTLGHCACLRMMLDTPGFDVQCTYSPCSCPYGAHDKTPKGTTLLHRAVKAKASEEIFKLLIEKGASAGATDANGKGPMAIFDL